LTFSTIHHRVLEKTGISALLFDFIAIPCKNSMREI